MCVGEVDVKKEVERKVERYIDRENEREVERGRGILRGKWIEKEAT